MKVKDLIEKLKGFDPELPVCLADWAEEYAVPSEHAAQVIGVSTANYHPAQLPEGSLTSRIQGTFVVIGSLLE